MVFIKSDGILVKMGKYAQIVMGPAGSGKSTFVKIMNEKLICDKRSVRCINLDPAAESLSYPISIDIRDLIKVSEVMEELSFGPNGGLVYAIEFFLENLEWFKDQLADDTEEEYLLIDCPGQIELYTHMDVMQIFLEMLQNENYDCCAVYIVDCNFMSDSSKFISGKKDFENMIVEKDH